MRWFGTPLEKALGYRFRKKPLLQTALTHPSYRYENEDVEEDNQRLEFLGDAALGLVAAAHLYEKYEQSQEGELTQLRSRLANTRTLARIAQSIALGDYLRLGHGEAKTGGQHRLSTLSDALESVIGAAYLDGGLRAVEKIFRTLFEPFLEKTSPDLGPDNPKGALQELCQKRWKTSPSYHLLKEEGPPHLRTFMVEVIIQGAVQGHGTGHNKRTAETAAAHEALLTLAAHDS